MGSERKSEQKCLASRLKKMSTERICSPCWHRNPTGKSEYLPRESQNPPTEDKSQQEVKQEKEVNRKDQTDDTKKSTKKGIGEGHIIRLSELQLCKIITESVRRIFDELS